MDEEIAIPQHAIDQWILRSGTKNPAKAKKRLQAMLRNSEEVDLKPEYRAIQLLNHGLQDARYFLYRSPDRGRKWILVVANNELKTVHNGASKNGANRWDTRGKGHLPAKQWKSVPWEASELDT